MSMNVYLTGKNADGTALTDANGNPVGAVVVKDAYAGPEGHDGEGQTVAVGGTSAASAAITASAIDVIFIPDAATTLGCFVQIANAPVAVANDDYYLAANQTYRFPITSGSKVACIQSVAAGDIYIHPVE